MDASLKKFAVGAVRLAAMSQLGPLAGGLFFAGGAVAAKLFAESEWAKTSAEMLMHLASDKASELFGSAAEGFRRGHNGDIEKSMHAAVRDAFDHLGKHAPPGFEEYFTSWRNFLVTRPPAEAFAAVPDLDPVALSYDDAQFRDLWWARMQPVLASWRAIEQSNFTQLNLSAPSALPPTLAAYLREHLPEAIKTAHDHELRDKKLEPSWIAYQERVADETLNHLLAIRRQLNRMEGTLAEIKDAVHPQSKLVWNIPRPIQHFQDRPDLILAIDQSLEHGATALTALHGLGGIGKTQLARGFADQRHKNYTLGAWIEAETSVSLLTSLSALAPLLGVQEEQDQKAKVDRVLNEISARQPWLVIFDNAVSTDDVRPYVERLSGVGHVLITSRDPNWDGLARTVSVTNWTVNESARFLLERTGQSDRESAEDLARDLDGLVLALEHAAAYMLAGDGMPLEEYRRVWKQKLKWVAKGHAYPDSVAAALGMSIDAAKRESPVAYDLLCLFAWLAPDLIPRKELLEAGASALPESLRAAFADHDAWTEVIAALKRYSLIRQHPPTGIAAGYFLHRVIQEIMRDRHLSDSTQEQWLRCACDILNFAFPFHSSEPASWRACEMLLPHARGVRARLGADSPLQSVGVLLSKAGLYLSARGLEHDAHDLRALALELAERQLEPGSLETTTRRSNLAITLTNLGEHETARQHLEMVLESRLAQLGPDDRRVAMARSNLAFALACSGKFSEARIQIESALESDLRSLPADHRDLALRRSNLAGILSRLDKHEEAKIQIELALNVFLDKLTEDHPLVATARSNLARALFFLNQHEKALSEVDEALRILRKHFPEEHPDVVAAENARREFLAAMNSR